MTKFNNDITPRLSLEAKISAIKNFGDIPKPALILEGKTDVSIYSRVLKLSKIDTKSFDIVVGNCKTNILSFHDNNLIPFKYVAILDSDFDRYKNNCRVEDNLLYTHFYDMENYLTTIDIISETYNDLDDIYTKNITKDNLRANMIECLHGFIAATKYKLKCLEKIESGQDIPVFALEDESIKNEKWWNKIENRVDTDKIKEFLFRFYQEKGVDFDNELWDNIVKSCIEEFNPQEADTSLNLIIKGRRMIEAYHVVFEVCLGNIMNKRDKEVFMNDLRKNIEKSEYINDMIHQLDSKLQTIVA